MRRQFISGFVAFVVTAIAVVGLNALVGLASAEAGGGSSPSAECAPYTDYWKLDVPSSVESNVASDAVGYDLDELRFSYTVRSDLTVAMIVVKGGQSSTAYSNSGVLELPSNVSHITFCFDTPEDTTTTTAPPETTTTAPPETTTTTEPPVTTTTTAPPETTTTTVPEAECPPGWGEVLPHQTARIEVDLPEAGTFALTGHGWNHNESALEGELWFVGYGTFPAPTTTPLDYDLGEVTVDAPTTLTIVVRPVGRVSVCVSASAEPVIPTTTTTAPPETTTTTAAPPTIGAVVGVECDNDTPWVSYDIDLNGLGDEATVRLANGNGSVEYRLSAGSGRLLWPGAVLDSEGRPVDWPGWDQDADGTWYLNPDDPYTWALQPLTVTIEVSVPTVGATGFDPVTIEYPSADAGCMPSTQPPVTTTTQPPVTTTTEPPVTTTTEPLVTTTTVDPEQPDTLPYTGLSTMLFAGLGLAAVALGTALVGLDRHRRAEQVASGPGSRRGQAREMTRRICHDAATRSTDAMAASTPS